jgi:DNA-directed RNA polymerase subunit K/omega
MINILSKYEKAKVLGMRASQIASNSPIYITLPKEFNSLGAL